MRVEFITENSAYQYQDPSRSKSYMIFSTEGLYKENKQDIFLKLSQGQDSRYFIQKRNL